MGDGCESQDKRTAPQQKVTRDADVVESNFDQQNRCMDEEADATSKVQATPADNLQCSDTPSVVNTSPRREDGTSGEIVSETKPPPMKAPKGWVRKKGSCSDKHLVTKKPPSVIRLNMQDLTKHVDAAKPTLQQIEGKDVVVLLGNTGTGKSTLMHVLAGRELREQSYKLGNSSVEKTVYEAVEPLEGFAIGHSQKSQTKHLMHYVRPPCPVLDREVVFLDSAGFGDTSGMEVDIATAISLSKVAQACRTLRFVVLISCTSLLESRGGAFRSLVKLMSRLVGTAETEKFDKLGYVFTFLFTHVTVLSSLNMGSDQGDGKDIELKQISCKLHSQLKEIKDGTDTGDPVVQTILMWMDTSLEDEISCVGVFHPKLTSSDWLLEATATFTEVDGYYTALGMEEGQRPQDVMTCVITQEHVHAIKVEVEHLKREFDMYLEHDQVDMLGPVRDAIQFLYSNVDLHCVKNVYFCAAALLNEKIWKSQQELNKFIESSTDDQVTKAGKGDYTIPESSTFEALAKRTFAHDEYVRQLSGLRMKDASLNEDVDEEGGAKVYLCARLHRLGDMLTKEPPIWKLLVWVEKLSAWAQADEHVQADQDMHSTEQANLTDGLAHKLTVHGKHVLNEGVANLMIACNNFIEDAAFQVGDCVEFAVAAGHIQGLLIHRDRIEMLGVCLMKLDSTWLRMEQHLEDILAFHVESAQKVLLDLSINASSNNSEAEQPGDLGAHVACLDAFVIFLIDAGAPSKFISKSTDSLQTILAEARNCVEEHAAIVDATSLRDSRSGPIVNNHVMLMKLLVLVLDKIRCEERVRCDHSKKLYDSTLKRLESSLRKQKTQLECLCDQMHREVLASTEFHSQLLSTLIAYTWLDDYLSPESQFVANKVEKHREEYLSHQETLHCQCLVSLNEYLQSPTEQCAAFSMLQERFSEAQQLVLICRSHFPAILNKEKHLSEVMDRTVKNWCLEQDKLVEYPNTLDTLSSFSSAVANSMLKACEDLRTVKPAESRIAELYNKLVAWLKKTADNIGSLVEAKGHFTSKQIVLDTLFHWQEQGLSHLTAQLPLLTDLQVSIGKSIAAQVKHLRELISESPNDDNIDAALKDLKDACCLDHHINQRASTELDSLTQLIEAKRAGLDKQLAENIQGFVFDGVERQLLSLRKSKDAQNKLRFQNLMNIVETAVKSKIALGEKQIGHGTNVAETYMLLKKAHRCVGKILKEHADVSIGDAMKSLEQKVGDHARAFIHRLQSAQNEQDHPRIQKLVRVLHQYIQCTDQLLDSELIRNGRALLAKGLEFQSHFQSLVESFVSNLDKEKNDTRELHTSLRNWQRALSSQQVDPEERSEYITQMKWLGDNLNIKHKMLVGKIETEASFALGVHVYTFLSREWEKGLKEHVIGLEFDIAEELKNHKRNEHTASTKRELSFMDIDDHSWKQELDCLNSSWTSYFGYWNNNNAYSHLKQELNGLMSKILDAVHKKVDSGDYEQQCGAMLKVFTHRLKELQSHIDGKGKLKQSLSRVKTQLLQQRKEQEKNLAVLLKDNHILDFTAAFRDYHKFIKHTSIQEDNQHNGDVHMLLCKYVETRMHHLKQQLDSFDFKKVCTLVKLLRMLGFLLAGELIGYVETRRMLKAKNDEWLQRLDVIQNQDFGGTRLKELAKHFSVMELDHNATQKDVESAFRRLSLKSHPDKPGGSNEKMQLLNEAKEALCNAGGLRKFNVMLRELFSQDICKIPERILASIKDYLHNSRYKLAHDLLQKLQSFNLLTEVVSGIPTAKDMQARVREVVTGHVSTIRANIHNHWDARQFKNLHDDFTRLTSIDSNLSMFSEMHIGQWYTDIRRSVEEEIDMLAVKAMSYLTHEKYACANIKNFAVLLIDLGRILDELPKFKNAAKGNIHNLLQTCQDNHAWGVPFLFKLGMELERGTVGTLGSDGKVTAEDQRIGRVLVSEFKQFGDVLTWIWNEKVIQQDVESTVKDIVSKKVSGSRTPANAQINQQHLLQGFKEYEHEYNAWFCKWYDGRATLEDIAQTCMANAAQLRPCCTKTWTKKVRLKIPSLLGAVFAYYTISKSGNTYMQLAGETTNANALNSGQTCKEMNKDSHTNICNMLIKPHNIQIVSILRMLGYDMATGNDRLVNHLMQIRTGEGKSMILGACSVILGLLGFNVRCICYSKYLSNRDFVLFEEIFSAFGMVSCIKYCTITEYCDNTVHVNGDVRNLTGELLVGNMNDHSNPLKVSSQPSNCFGLTSNNTPAVTEEILLVDEVDVFFGKDFYGQTRSYPHFFCTPESKAIIQSIWENRSKFHTCTERYADVVKSAAYTHICKAHPDWEFLLEHEVQKMCRQVGEFENHEYKFDRALNSVGYPIMDGMDYNCFYGYLTAFAYLNEARKQNLRNSDKTLDRFLGLQINCGSYLYSEIKPACILGVSGTVQALGKYEWDVMNRYGIDIYTRMPSVYGRSKFRFLDQPGEQQVIVESTKEGYFREVTDAAKKAVNKGRAVIVFFQNNSRLQEYMSSVQYVKVVNKGILDETLAHEEKNYIIKKAATSGQVTFTTAVFGRGTDFHCYDQQVLSNGGVHVIQTFLSASKMEEIQIQGRTARQGAEGTYSMVLLETDLQSLIPNISAESARHRTKADLYCLLDKERQKRHEQDCQNIEKSLMSNTKVHKSTLRYLAALLAGDSKLAFKLGKELWLK